MMLSHGLFDLPALAPAEKFFLRGLCALPDARTLRVEGMDLSNPDSERTALLEALEAKGRVHCIATGVTDDGVVYVDLTVRREFVRTSP